VPYVRPAQVADGLAELQVRWPSIAIVYAETRKLAQEYTYRYLAAAYAWAIDEQATLERISAPEGLAASAPMPSSGGLSPASQPPEPSTAQLRAWARARGLDVSDRGRLRPEIHRAWLAAHRQEPTTAEQQQPR
jgi:hypothetical protein